MIVTFQNIKQATLIMNNIGKCSYRVCFIAKKFIYEKIDLLQLLRQCTLILRFRSEHPMTFAHSFVSVDPRTTHVVFPVICKSKFS